MNTSAVPQFKKARWQGGSDVFISLVPYQHGLKEGCKRRLREKMKSSGSDLGGSCACQSFANFRNPKACHSSSTKNVTLFLSMRASGPPRIPPAASCEVLKPLYHPSIRPRIHLFHLPPRDRSFVEGKKGKKRGKPKNPSSPPPPPVLRPLLSIASVHSALLPPSLPALPSLLNPSTIIMSSLVKESDQPAIADEADPSVVDRHRCRSVRLTCLRRHSDLRHWRCHSSSAAAAAVAVIAADAVEEHASD